ncbi:MAG: histidinol dehydrogenase [Deltaproteobacteria bacterium]|nr:histidinol dehydrogenase [Deltaproteobacteria bacterium]
MNRSVTKIVLQILSRVQKEGDKALIGYTRRFDRLPKSHHLEVTGKERREAWRKADPVIVQALKKAAKRIRHFHEHQKSVLFKKQWGYTLEGIRIGQKCEPISRVGIYVPGGRATYPSTVLMNSIPAKVAGVNELIMASPWPGGVVNPYTLIAAELAGVDRLFKIGGAQAVAALAFGTQSIPKVDKIVGPGNIFVATAKRLVFGQVGIDMIAGPTEVVIIADESARADWVASDLISQAEHDPEARAILISPSSTLIRNVKREVERSVPRSPRKKILEASFENHGRCLRVKNLKEACEKANRLAPEHLVLMTRSPRKILPLVKNAGAIFLGHYSPVALGDYAAGPNHVLPTAATARFSSPLGVGDFLKSSSLIEASAQGLAKITPMIEKLALVEGLTGHAESVRVRSR